MTEAQHKGYDLPPDLARIAPAGHYIALRIGYAFPLEEINALPPAWVTHYMRNHYMLRDPVIRWAFEDSGATRWSAITLDDPMQILEQAHEYGLRYGVVTSCFDIERGQRSFGSFVRGDREFSDAEIDVLRRYLTVLHKKSAPPSNITAAEIEALAMVRDGKRLKQIAFDLGVTEGAVKQRLKNAKTKLGASTNAQAASLAATFGLL